MNSTKCCNLYIFCILNLWSLLLRPDSGVEYCDERDCLFVCLFASISLETHVQTATHFLHVVYWSTDVLRSSFGGVAIYYVLPVYGWRYFPHNGPYGDLSIPCQCRRCMILRWLTPLLLVNDCVLSYTTAGETARRIHRTKGAGGVVCDVSLPS